MHVGLVGKRTEVSLFSSRNKMTLSGKKGAKSKFQPKSGIIS